MARAWANKTPRKPTALKWCLSSLRPRSTARGRLCCSASVKKLACALNCAWRPTFLSLNNVYSEVSHSLCISTPTTQCWPIKSLEDLKGKNISFPAPNAFAASLLIRAELAKRKINTQAVFVKTHSNVYRSVIGQDAAAGGGVNNTLASEAPEVRQQLRVLFETSGYTPHPIVTLPSLPAPVREKFFKAFTQLAQDDEGRKLLSGVGIEKPQAVTYAKHYKVLESLQLEKFLVLSPSP